MTCGLTVFGPCKVSKDAEGLGLEVGRSAGPLGQLGVLLLWLDDSLVHGGSAVYQRVFHREGATERNETHTSVSCGNSSDLFSQ